MFCPKCGKENVEGVQLCSSCSWVLGSASTMPSPDAKTSKAAIWALVLGILAPFTCLLTTLPAIICGIVGLVKINKSRGQLKGTALAITGMVIPVAMLPIVAIMAAISVPIMRGRIDAAKWSEGKAMMGTISTAIRAYHADKGTDATPPTIIVGTGDTALGFAATDLEGTYFRSSDFSMNVTSMS
ncbi:MAG: DUF4190 domain-containing protein, partial [Sedimentisphaerales bacterium]|nr:DUF4190 domain-containing protein [Sedimentisphaerales bacterium]